MFIDLSMSHQVVLPWKKKLLYLLTLKNIVVTFPKEFREFSVNEAKICLYQLGIPLQVFRKLRKSFLKFGNVQKRLYSLWETFGEGNVEKSSRGSCYRNLSLSLLRANACKNQAKLKFRGQSRKFFFSMIFCSSVAIGK